jgi:predicted ATP-binding protein involved in virulence
MTEPRTLLRLDTLTLRNYRCFADCSLAFHPQLTVLVAENGYGKTATLDAIGLALDVFVSAIAYNRQSRGFGRMDAHLIRGNNAMMVPALPTAFSASGVVGNEIVTWGRALTRYDERARNTTRDTKAIRLSAKRLREDADGASPDASVAGRTLPLVVFYGTGRLWSEHRLTEGKKTVWPAAMGRYAAYLDCLSSSSSFKAFVAWYEETAGKARSAVSKAYGPEERPHEHLAAVRDAVRTVLEPTGWTSIDWEFPPMSEDGVPQSLGFLAVEHPEYGRIPLSFLSDGIRNMVALAGDLAHRCVRLNPHLGEQAARMTPGILLIDEVDMHLHPRWQQQIIALLRMAFQGMQIVVSTHSPHVLSTVDKESIRLLLIDPHGQGSAPSPRDQTCGDESGNVLARAMHVNPVPDIGPSRLLSEYRGLVQRGLDQSERAQAVWRDLMTHFGAEHHLLHEAAVLRDLQEFKREHAGTAGGAQ